MRVLKELAPQVEISNVLKRLGGKYSAKNQHRTSMLLQLVRDQPDVQEKELARALFGKTRSANHPPYLELVKEVTWATLQEVLEPRGRYVSRPARHELMIRCDRLITLIDTLGGGLSDAQLQLWHKLSNSCNKCDYVSLELECLTRKYKYYTFQQLDEQKNAELERNINELSVVLEACNKCKSAMLMVRGALADATPLPDHFDLIEIQSAVDTFPHFDVQVYGGEVLISLAMQQKNYGQAIKRIQQVYGNLVKRFPRESNLLISLSFQQLLCYVALQDYPRGKKAWDQLFAYYRNASSRNSRYQALEAGMLLLLRCEKTSEAPDFLRPFTALGGIGRLPERARGRWYAIFSALRLLTLRDNISNAVVENYYGKLKRKQQSIQARQEDQVTVAIMEICYLVLTGNLKKASRKIALLAPFTPRRLSPDSPLYRRGLFLKLLQEGAAANFHPVALRRKTAKLQDKLVKSALSIDEEALSNEILSFNTLWLLIINGLPMRQ